MKAVGLILLMFFIQSCFFHPYFKNEEWWYFEDWDSNGDFIIDQNEFTKGFDENMKTKGDSPDIAAAKFVTADENGDKQLSALEFYKWEASL